MGRLIIAITLGVLFIPLVACTSTEDPWSVQGTIPFDGKLLYNN